LQTRYEDFKKAGAEILAISSSPWEKHAAMASSLGLEFPVLSDPEGRTFLDYGVLHPGALPMADAPIARPAELILDESRVVLKRFATDNWRVRERPERLLAELE